jgi:hypothetical protein
MDYSNLTFPNIEYFIRLPLGDYLIGLSEGIILGNIINITIITLKRLIRRRNDGTR